MHRRHGSDGDRIAMRQSAVHFGFNGQHTTRFGKSRLKYVFTMEGVTLSCGSALLQAANEAQPPTVSLQWTSGRKKVFGGVVRVLPVHEGGGARWPRPVSMACSLTSNSKSSSRFEPRHSTVTLRIEGTRAARRKLVGTLDLATFAGYERTSTKVTIPLEHGAGSLQARARARAPHNLGRTHAPSAVPPNPCPPPLCAPRKPVSLRVASVRSLT